MSRISVLRLNDTPLSANPEHQQAAVGINGFCAALLPEASAVAARYAGPLAFPSCRKRWRPSDDARHGGCTQPAMQDTITDDARCGGLLLWPACSLSATAAHMPSVADPIRRHAGIAEYLWLPDLAFGIGCSLRRRMLSLPGGPVDVYRIGRGMILVRVLVAVGLRDPFRIAVEQHPLT